MAKAAAEDAEFDKENKQNGVNTSELDAEFGFPSEFPYEFGSFGVEPLNSPVESVAGSSETESSDEEDFFTGLTRRLSQASLRETRPSQLTVPISKVEIQKKARVFSGSPQSTLSGIGSWSGRSSGSGEGSPNGTSRVPSPTMMPFSNEYWEVIYAAAAQVARVKMNDDVSRFDFHNRGLVGGLPPPPTLLTNQNLHHGINNHVSQVQLMKQQSGSVWGSEPKSTFSTQQQQLQAQNKVRDFGYGGVKCTRPLAQSAWHPLQVKQQNQQVQLPHGGSASRPFLQGGSGGKRGCAGTGVFLPRQYGAPSPESRKKTSCTPVVLPAKVMHALNMNIDDLNATHQSCFSSPFGADYDALVARRNALLMQQRLSLRREASNYEIRLPQEWSY